MIAGNQEIAWHRCSLHLDFKVKAYLERCNIRAACLGPLQAGGSSAGRWLQAAGAPSGFASQPQPDWPGLSPGAPVLPKLAFSKQEGLR